MTLRRRLRDLWEVLKSEFRAGSTEHLKSEFHYARAGDDSILMTCRSRYQLRELFRIANDFLDGARDDIEAYSGVSYHDALFAVGLLKGAVSLRKDTLELKTDAFVALAKLVEAYPAVRYSDGSIAWKTRPPVKQDRYHAIATPLIRFLSGFGNP